MSNLTVALLASLAYFICYAGNWLIGQCMIERPIVVGWITGLLLGDMSTGIIIGAALEAIYMGAVNIGGATSAEPVSATVMSVTFAITAGLTMEEAITLAVPVGLAFNSLGIVFMMLNNIFAPRYKKVCETGNPKGLTQIILISWFTLYFVRTIIIFLCIYLGSEAVTAAMNSLPQPVTHGLTVASGMLGAVGMAVLMKMLITRDNVGWLFVGFLLSKYLNLPAMVIAIFAVVIAITIGMNEKKVHDLEAAMEGGGTVTKSEEEDFFA